MRQIITDLWVPENFAENHHYYADELGEKEYTGTTTILKVIAKPALIQWAANEAVGHLKAKAEPYGKNPELEKQWLVSESLLKEASVAHRKKKEAAGEHGTDAHALVEKYINLCLETQGGKPLVYAPVDEWKPIQKFMEWSFATVDHFIFSERPLVDKTLWVAGTCDFAYVGKDGLRYLSDFKTSSGIWWEYWLQVAAYRHMAELLDEKYDLCSIVRLGKDGKFEVQWREGDHFEAFKAALTLYRKERELTH